MHIFQHYIDKNIDRSYVNVDPIETSASIFVIIPCYNEPDIITTLSSLSRCNPPQSKVAIIIVVNSSEKSHPKVLNQNLITLSGIEEWKKKNIDSFLEVHTIHAKNLPVKYAGVGWARKIGMDEAVRQLILSDQNDGILISFDADSTVLPNYLQAIEQSFKENPTYNFFTLDFAHPIENIPEKNLRAGIIRYELHMRYYRNAMQWCGYPHAIHTVGSSFAVKASAYVKQGGMNRKKAGEDFYFLHKIVLLGKYGNIRSTTVFPSARESDRVPFGTGAAMKKWAEGNPDLMTTYSLDAFIPLKLFFEKPAQFLGMAESEIKNVVSKYPVPLNNFIELSGTVNEILELQANCSGTDTFTRRFFHRINAFWILKYLNYAHECCLVKGELFNEAIRLLQKIGIKTTGEVSPEQLLGIYRTLDRKN